MKSISLEFSNCYLEALRTHLDAGAGPTDAARGLGKRALDAGLATLDLARLHEHILLREILPEVPSKRQAGLIKRAAAFFAAALVPETLPADSPREASRHERVIANLSQRMLELAAAKLRLSMEVTRRKIVEQSLKASEVHQAKSLKEARLLKEQLRSLSRQVLSVQEDERRKISRDLHDVIAQSLMSINVRLATLKKQVWLNTKEFHQSIAVTQRLLEKTARIVHRFASQLRPPVLDDLGLIPALHSFLNDFIARTGVQAELTIAKEVELLTSDQRTAMFRVTQEALTNVERHAKASCVKVAACKAAKTIVMTISDDGKSFDVARIMGTDGGKHLGLLGMRERVEMVGGSFQIDSAPGRGTTVSVRIPLAKPKPGGAATTKPRKPKSLIP